MVEMKAVDDNGDKIMDQMMQTQCNIEPNFGASDIQINNMILTLYMRRR